MPAYPVVSTLIYDGTSVDPSQFDSPELQTAPYLFVTPAGLQQGTVYGFSGPGPLQAWLSTSALLLSEFAHIDELRQRALEVAQQPGFDEELMREVQVAQVAEASQGLFKGLGRQGRSSTELDKLIVDYRYDPLLGPPGNTAWLYGQPNYSGKCVSLSGGWTYPKMSLFGFDDRTTSVVVSSTTVLYENAWFTGRQLALLARTAIANLRGAPYYFDDRTSSAIVG